MRLPIYQIDAFSDRPFTGNPAAVVLLEAWLDDETQQAIAAENNMTTTAFLIDDESNPKLRWFTPTIEEEICGHATMATAWLVFNRLRPSLRQVTFDTRAGALRVDRRDDGRLAIDFPTRPPKPVMPHPDLLAALGNPRPREILAGRDYLVVLEDAAAVRAVRPDFRRLGATDRHATIVTAPGDNGFDCVSRFFAPGHGIDEDPATGAAHASVAPYWAARLDKPVVRAFQASKRGGTFECHLRGERVTFVGNCAFYMEGAIEI
ncbi:MAG: PhzF family phenazine biosynthesis protein [Variibacter sp.]